MNTQCQANAAPRPRVLSIGFTRSLWHSGESVDGDTMLRMRCYAAHIASYHVLTHALRRHRLEPTLRLGDTFWAYATNSRTGVGSALAMLRLGHAIARRNAINLVQAQDPLYTGVVGALLSWRLGVPFNVCVYGPNPFDRHWVAAAPRNRLLAGLGRAVLRSAAGVQVDGLQTEQSLIAVGIAAARIHRKPVVPQTLHAFFAATPDAALRAQLSAGGRYTQLALFVGRLAPQKDLPLLVRAFARLARDHPALRLVCVGEGEGRAALERDLSARGLVDQVVLLGAQPHAMLPVLMASCDAFLLPSRYEGFARVLMEAAAAGLPIVTTQVSGADEAVVAGESGFTTPVGDDTAFAQAIRTLLVNPARVTAMGQAGRQHMRAFAAHWGDPLRQVAIWHDLLSAARASRTNTLRKGEAQL